MSAPIDELLIAVRIEQGSNLMELYEMLRELMGTGGGINIEFPWMVSQQAWQGLLTRLDNLRDCCRGLHELIPSIRDELIAHLNTVADNLIAALVDQFMFIVENKIEPDLDTFRMTLNDLMNYIKIDVMNQLSHIIEKIKENKIDKSVFEDILKKIASVRKVVVDYGKTTTKIKDILTKGKFGVLIKDNKELLDNIIENKEEFEPKVMEFLEKLEETIKIGDDNLGDRLEQFLRENVNMLLTWMPHEFSEQFLRVFQTIEKTEKNIIDRLGEPGRPAILTDEEIELNVPEERVTQEDIDMVVGVVEEKLNDIYDRVEAIMEDIRYQVGRLARAGEILELRQWWDNLEKYIKDIVRETKDDYWLVEKDVKKIFNRLKKIPMHRTFVREIIEEYFDKALTKFKPILDKNLEEKIGVQFNEFLQNLNGVLDTRLFAEEEFPDEELAEDILEEFPEGTISTTQDLWREMSAYEDWEKLQKPTGPQIAENLLREILANREVKETVAEINENVKEVKDKIKPISDAEAKLNEDKAKAEETRKRSPIT